jgi:hypothetical protein
MSRCVIGSDFVLVRNNCIQPTTKQGTISRFYFRHVHLSYMRPLTFQVSVHNPMRLSRKTYRSMQYMSSDVTRTPFHKTITTGLPLEFLAFEHKIRSSFHQGVSDFHANFSILPIIAFQSNTSHVSDDPIRASFFQFLDCVCRRQCNNFESSCLSRSHSRRSVFQY